MRIVTSKIYSIKELEELTGFMVRTIRFYIKEGLVPRPDGTGGGASYNDKHILCLQAIKLLDDSQIKLSGIKKVLSGMTEEQMRSFVADAETGKRAWDTASLEKWVQPGNVTSSATVSRNFSFSAIGNSEPAQGPKSSSASILGRLSRSTEPPQETWMRLRPIEGVEVSIRNDVDQKTKELVMQLARQLQNR